MSELSMPEASRCTHWNDSAGSIALRPLRCVGEAGHAGRHWCGDTAWTTDLGFWQDTAEEETP